MILDLGFGDNAKICSIFIASAAGDSHEIRLVGGWATMAAAAAALPEVTLEPHPLVAGAF